MEKWHQHLGVYGVYLNDHKILVVKKTRGPYIHRYDLPGGSFSPNESMITCLKRELVEETSHHFMACACLGIYDYLVPYEAEKGITHVHHMAIYYSVELNDLLEVTECVADDTSGYDMVTIELLNINNASPLVLEAVNIIKKGTINHEMKRYDDWNILRKAIF